MFIDYTHYYGVGTKPMVGGIITISPKNGRMVNEHS